MFAKGEWMIVIWVRGLKTLVYPTKKPVKIRKKSSKFVDFFSKVYIIWFCMDTMNDCMIPECGNLAELVGKRFVVGAKQLRKALGSGTAKTVYLAKNADPAITAPIMEQCKLNSVPCVWVRTMQDLGRACGIEVGAAAAAAVD
jgi:large subunit ribosomal protein L7A